MASNYDGLTVADLKEVLRERGLPVSGAKGVLIARLQDHDARSAAAVQPSEAPSDATEVYDALQVKEGKVKFRCRVCGVLLAVPPGYKGKVECPACKTQQPVPKPSTLDGRYPFDLTRNQWSMAVSITGVVIALVAIFIFFSAFSYDVMCPEEARGEIVQDGETYKTCDGGSWGPTLTRLFVSCFVLVPLAAALTQSGFALRKPKVSLQQPIHRLEQDLNLRPRLCRSTTGAVLRFGLGRSVATGCEICWWGSPQARACRFGGRCLCCLHHLSSLLLVVLNVFSLEQTVPFKEHKHEQKHNKTS